MDDVDRAHCERVNAVMRRPLVTCGMTSYNAAATIERAVHSVFAQTWRPIEVILVDDCSSDTTSTVLRRLEVEFPGLHVLRNEKNLGVAASRNRVIDRARGEFVAFFDDDDVSDPERVARQVRRIVDYEREFARGAKVVCHTARLQVFPDGREIIMPTAGTQESRLAPFGLDMSRHILLGDLLVNGGGGCATCSQMARLSTYKDAGGFDPLFRRSEDTEFIIRLGRAGAHFVGIGTPLVVQAMTHASEKTLAEECRHTLMYLEKHRDLFKSNAHLSFCSRWITSKYALLSGRLGSPLFGFASLVLRHPVYFMRRFLVAWGHAAHNRSLRRFHTTSSASS
jgi:glycosyltransferase involved in cell wall biosynthesis